MTDIVERLLHMVPVDILGGKPMLLNPDGPAAVHEIDQLRNEIINFRAETERLREVVYQYRDDLQYPPSADSIQRRLKMIDDVLEGK